MCCALFHGLGLLKVLLCLGLSSVTLGSRVLFAGGVGSAFPGSPNNASFNVIDVFDSVTLQLIRSTNALSETRGYMGATVANNKAYFAGGLVKNASEAVYPSDAIDVVDSNGNLLKTLRLSVPRMYCPLLLSLLFHIFRP